jgi:predicted RNA-binding Zn ribbon-like protein
VTAQASIPGEREHPSLALVNSRHRSRSGMVDHLTSPEALDEWLAWRSLAARGAAASEEDLEAALALRDAVRELIVASVEGRAPAASAVATVNEASAVAPAADQLRWEDGEGFVRTRMAPGAGELRRALAALAEDAIGLVSGERREDLIACEAPGCVRLLLKDHPRRHWCSTRCGDRVRAARYYRRSRERSG